MTSIRDEYREAVLQKVMFIMEESGLPSEALSIEFAHNVTNQIVDQLQAINKRRGLGLKPKKQSQDIFPDIAPPGLRDLEGNHTDLDKEPI